MPAPTKRKYRVTHEDSNGKISGIWISPWKDKWRFPWRETPSSPWKYIARKTKPLIEEVALEKLRQGPQELSWAALPPGRRAFLETVDRLVPDHDQAAVLAFLESRKKSALLSATVERFIEFKTPLGSTETDHAAQMARDLRALALAFPKALVTDISLDQLTKWWNERTGTAAEARRKAIRGTLVQFWKWARKDGVAGNDVDTLAQRLPTIEVPAGQLEYFELEELEYLLTIVGKEWFPLVILGAFQGVRPEEIAPKKGNPKARMQWESIDWEFNYAVVTAEVSKTRKKNARARKFPLHPVTRAWLEAYGAEGGWKGPICKRNPTEVWDGGERLTTKWGRMLAEKFPTRFTEWPQDALRKSFASYRIAVVRNMDQVALEMGNSDEMLHGFYNNPRLVEEGEAWFGFFPAMAKALPEYLKAA